MFSKCRNGLHSKCWFRNILCILLIITILPFSTVRPLKTKAASPSYITANFIGGDVIPYTTLTTSMFSVMLVYDNGSKTTVKDFTINPTYVATVGVNKIAISYYTGSTTLSTTCDVTCVSSANTKYTIYFNSNGGTSVDSIYDIAPNSTIPLPTPPTKTNFWFRGWYTDAALTNQFTDFTKVNSNLTLYAKWEQKTSGDTFNLPISDGTYNTNVGVNLAGQTYDSSVELIVKALSPKSVEKAAATIADTKKYLAFELSMIGYEFRSESPLPVSVTIPSGFDTTKTAVYYTTNRTTVMGRMPGTVSNGGYHFNAYEAGTYILIEGIDSTPPAVTEKDPIPTITLDNITSLKVSEQAPLIREYHNFYGDESDYTFYWESNNPSIASVDRNGVVTGKKVGKTTVFCYSGDGTFNTSATVSVVVDGTAVKKITPAVTKKTLKKGATYQLKVTVTPKNATKKKLSYTSSKKSVATVNSSGKITAKKKGSCVITIKTTDGTNLTKKVTITVK